MDFRSPTRYPRRSALAAALLIACAPAFADARRCLVSFDSATLDVCSGEVHLAGEALRPLAEVARFTGAPLRIVKFDAPIRAEQRAALERAGARIIGYAPHYAYLVRMPATLDAQARTIPGVIWSGPFLPVWKLDVNLAKELAGVPIVEPGGIEELNVTLHPGANAAAARATLAATPGLRLRSVETSGDHERMIVGFDRARLAEDIFTLAQQPEIASIGLHWPSRFENSQAGWLHQSGDPDHLPVFERGIFGCGQIVGVADSGLYASHCSFTDPAFGQPAVSVCTAGAACSPIAPDFGHRKIGAYYKWSGESGSQPGDNHGHGTHVMGSLLGNNLADPVDCDTYTSPGGLTNLDGTAPGARLIAQEMGASLQYLNNLGGTLYHAATTAYDSGARIHSDSWSSDCRNSSGLCVAGCQVEYREHSRGADAAVWEHPDLLVFVAAGNSGGEGGSAGCGPGADVGAAGNAKNVFSIGSNDRGSAGNDVSGFSSRGPTQDRRTKPDLTAQGANIVSAGRSTCGTATASGTSMATPTAAGLAALTREYLQRGFYPTGVENPLHAIEAPSAALIKAILIAGARTLDGSGSLGGAPGQSQGWGRIHLDDALYFAGDARMLRLHDEKAGLETGAVHHHSIQAQAGQALVVTLVWHDAPALVNANPHGVNQLRLEVETPSGEVWTQKLRSDGGLADADPYQDTTSADHDESNNVHRIRFDAPEAGEYAIRVRAIQVAQGPQPYALAVTGAISGMIAPDFWVIAAPARLALCAGAPANFDIGVAAGAAGFADMVTLDVGGLPDGVDASFSANPVAPADPPASSVLTLADTSGLAAGLHALSVSGSSSGPTLPPHQHSAGIELDVAQGAPASGQLATPPDTAIGLPLRPEFSWAAFEGAWKYRLEVATDAQFGHLVVDEELDATQFRPSTPLSGDTTYYWRVSGINPCGAGKTSDVFRFATANLVCGLPDLAIPDNAAAGVTSVLNAAGGGTLAGLRLTLDIEHGWVGDLEVRLFKDDTEVLLVNRPGWTGTGFGCGSDDIRVTLDDDGQASIQSDCASGNEAQAYAEDGVYRPANPLSAFAGQTLAGAWSLRVADRFSGYTGTLRGWCLAPVPQAGSDIFEDDFE